MKSLSKTLACSVTLAAGLLLATSAQSDLESVFKNPRLENRLETWFRLIGVNVSREGLTRDLESVAAAGVRGIQLFHDGWENDRLEKRRTRLGTERYGTDLR